MIRDMYRKGLSISVIARETGRDRKTVRKVIQAGLAPAVEVRPLSVYGQFLEVEHD